eukprot:SAG11_NODE_243_length_11749_cov_33.422918_1_plen_60_part_00
MQSQPRLLLRTPSRLFHSYAHKKLRDASANVSRNKENKRGNASGVSRLKHRGFMQLPQL